ncbi:MAG: endo alpha-1,4 polygalactosaminidase [Phycisphaerales bacterium]|nr:endo alpha-1,4 polygalactosaminidase [Phycisphaerales bacterium]
MREDHVLRVSVTHDLCTTRRVRLSIAMSVLVFGCLGNGCPMDQPMIPEMMPEPMLDKDAPPITEGDWYRPGVNTSWQWQLQPDANGQINTSYDVDVYDVDLFDVGEEQIRQLQAAGRKVICYFSAGSYEAFRVDAAEFNVEDYGNVLQGFEDENWLDIRSPNVHRIMRMRLDLAVAKGCDCVEPDNMDGYQNNSGFDLTADDQLAFNRFIANEAHMRKLSVGLKNDLDQIPELVNYFDFAVNEQCHEFNECELNDPFIDAGKPVFNAEYADPFVNDAAQQAAMCAAAVARNLRTLVLPLDLDDSFRISCDP